MEQWVKFFAQLGVAVAALYALGVFFKKEVWPNFVKQLDDAQAARKAEIDKFVDTIKTRDALYAETQRETVRALEALTNEIRKPRSRRL